MGHASFFYQGAASLIGYAEKHARHTPGFWVRPKDVSSFIAKKIGGCGSADFRLASGCQFAWGYKQAKADFVAGCKRLRSVRRQQCRGTWASSSGNREFKDLKVARIKKDMAGSNNEMVRVWLGESSSSPRKKLPQNLKKRARHMMNFTEITAAIAEYLKPLFPALNVYAEIDKARGEDVGKNLTLSS